MAAHVVHALRSHKTDLGVRRNVDDHVFLHTNVMHVHRHSLAPHQHQHQFPSSSTSSTIPRLRHGKRKDKMVSDGSSDR